MTNEHRTIIELSDAEQDLVAGGSIVCEPVLHTGSGKLNFNANAWDTPANGDGFSGYDPFMWGRVIIGAVVIGLMAVWLTVIGFCSVTRRCRKNGFGGRKRFHSRFNLSLRSDPPAASRGVK